MGADPTVALALAPQQGITFGGSTEGEVMRPVEGGTHGYFPDFKEIETGFVAFGRGIQKNVVVRQMGWKISRQ